MGSIQLTFPTRWELSICTSGQRDCYVYPWRGSRNLPPRQHYCLLTALPSSLHPLSSLIRPHRVLTFTFSELWLPKSLNPPNNLRGKNYYVHFTDEETEALGAEVLESESKCRQLTSIFSASTLQPLLPSHCFLVEWLWANNFVYISRQWLYHKLVLFVVTLQLF